MSYRVWTGLGHLAVLALLILCVIPLPPPPEGAWPWTDKLEHALAFLVLTWWFAVARPPAARLGTAAWLVLLGAGIELVQWFLPWRSASVGDLLADSLGVALGLALAALTAAGFPRLRPAE